MYFVSERDGQGIFQLWYTTRSGSGWATPQKLGTPFSNKSKMYPNAASNGNLYFSQLDDDNRSYFYMAKNNNGIFETPAKLSSAVNAFYFHVHAFIAPDESYLVFDAIPTQQSTGSSIFVSFKKSDNTWGDAVKLNSTINSTDNQYCPSISPDGKYLFFTKQGDLWWVDAKVVKDLKPADVKDEHEMTPQGFQLYQNYPNPFNPTTVMSYRLPVTSSVKLVIYDMLGRPVSVLVDAVMPSRTYQVTWNAATFPSGVYFYSLHAGNFVQTRKMILTK
jgi:hypothetical protein